MKHTAQALIILAAFSLAGCATQSPKPQEPSPAEELEATVQMPQSLGKLSMAHRQVYEDPAAGIGYRYTGDMEMAADVFVYPLSDSQEDLLISEGEQAVLEDGYNSFRGELGQALQQGRYESVTPVEEHIRSAAFTFGNPEQIELPFLFARGEFLLVNNGNEFKSFAYMSEFEGYFVKVRISHWDYPGLNDNAEWFFQSLADHLYQQDMQEQLMSVTISHEETNRKHQVQQLPGESAGEFFARAARGFVVEGGEK